MHVHRPISHGSTPLYDSCEFVKMQIGSTCNVSARCWYEQTSECEPVARKVHSDLLIEYHAAAALPFYLKDLASGNTKCHAHVVILTTDWRNQNAIKNSNGTAYSGITLHILLTVLSTWVYFLKKM